MFDGWRSCGKNVDGWDRMSLAEVYHRRSKKEMCLEIAQLKSHNSFLNENVGVIQKNARVVWELRKTTGGEQGGTKMRELCENKGKLQEDNREEWVKGVHVLAAFRLVIGFNSNKYRRQNLAHSNTPEILLKSCPLEKYTGQLLKSPARSKNILESFWNPARSKNTLERFWNPARSKNILGSFWNLAR